MIAVVDHVSVPLGGALDPVVMLGRPDVGARGALTFPLLVVSGGDAAWLAVGHVRQTRSAVDVAAAPIPSRDAEVAVRRAAGIAAERWGAVLRSEQAMRERLANRRAARVAAVSRRAAVDAEIAALDVEIADLETVDDRSSR
jgi:hypothetical protein